MGLETVMINVNETSINKKMKKEKPERRNSDAIIVLHHVVALMIHSVQPLVLNAV